MSASCRIQLSGRENFFTTNHANVERIETSSLDIGYSASFRMADGGVNLECWNGGTVGPCGPVSIWPVDGREGWMRRNMS